MAQSEAQGDDAARRTSRLIAVLLMLQVMSIGCAAARAMERIRVDEQGRGFAGAESGRPFVPWGFNYDHDRVPRLLEEYWEEKWATVAEDFREMKGLGANVVRIHLQLYRFMDAPERPNERSLAQLRKLIGLAEEVGLYLNLTGLGCYRRQDVPEWYSMIKEEGPRWAVQARFWEAVAACGAESPAIFCYDLMNEPVVAAGRREDGQWLAGEFGGFSFVQFITLDQRNRPRREIARQWVRTMTEAIRKHDRQHMVTVGLLPNHSDNPEGLSGFMPELLKEDLDFICVHAYPEQGKVERELRMLENFAVGRPLVIEEMFPLKCSADELEQFIVGSKRLASGWFGFYWGETPAELRGSQELSARLTLDWLELFQKLRPGEAEK